MGRIVRKCRFYFLPLECVWAYMTTSQRSSIKIIHLSHTHTHTHKFQTQPLETEGKQTHFCKKAKHKMKWHLQSLEENDYLKVIYRQNENLTIIETYKRYVSFLLIHDKLPQVDI